MRRTSRLAIRSTMLTTSVVDAARVGPGQDAARAPADVLEHVRKGCGVPRRRRTDHLRGGAMSARMRRSARRQRAAGVVVTAVTVFGSATVPGSLTGANATRPAQRAPVAAAPVRGTVHAPRPSDVVSAMHRAIDYYRGSYAVATGVRNGWSWSTYFDGVLQAYRASGEAGLLGHAMAWGRDTSWTIATREEDANEIKAAQTYADLDALDPAASTASAEARMRAGLSLPDDTWTWADALFMAMPSAARWARRTGDATYLDTMERLYRWTRDDGITVDPPAGSPAWDCPGRPAGLYDRAERLWYRDCSFIGRLDTGRKVFWGRGNAWVAAAMAETLEQLPLTDPRARPYVTMLRDLASRLRELQGTDGMWRTSLLDAARYPVPETSATGLFAYAIARGVTLGVLDRDAYAPVALRAWDGLTRISLQPSGFLSRCQGVGDRPGTPYQGTAPRTPASSTSPGTLHLDAPPYCVGAFLLAGSAVAGLPCWLTTGRPERAAAEPAANEVRRLVDGDPATRWSASTVPRPATCKRYREVLRR